MSRTTTAFGVVYPPYTRHTAGPPRAVDTGTARSPDGTAPTPTRYCGTDTLHRQRERDGASPDTLIDEQQNEETEADDLRNRDLLYLRSLGISEISVSN